MGPIAEKAIGIELVVAQKIEDVAMEFVGAALDGEHDGCPAGVTKFGRGVAGDDFHFFEGVHIGRIADTVIDGVIDVDAVEQKVVGLFAIAVHVGARAEARVHAGRIRAHRTGN